MKRRRPSMYTSIPKGPCMPGKHTCRSIYTQPSPAPPQSPSASRGSAFTSHPQNLSLWNSFVSVIYSSDNLFVHRVKWPIQKCVFKLILIQNLYWGTVQFPFWGTVCYKQLISFFFLLYLCLFVVLSLRLRWMFYIYFPYLSVSAVRSVSFFLSIHQYRSIG